MFYRKLDMRKITRTILIATFVAGAHLAYAAENAPEYKAKIKVNGAKGNTQPPQHDKKLFITFDKSQAFAKLMQEKLSERGYVVVQEKAGADLTINFSGMFKLNGKNISTDVLKFAELDSIAYKSEGETKVTASLLHAGATAGALGLSIIPITELGVWLSQVTGVSGFFNKMITGDPRGFCMHENCEKIEQRAIVTVNTTNPDGSNGHIGMKLAVSFDEKIVIDQVIERVLAETLEYFPASTNSK